MARKRHPEPARRAWGSGSVYQRKSDGRWVASLRVEGKPVLRYAEHDRNDEARALELLAELQAEVARAGDAYSPDQTVRDFLRYWLEEHVRRKRRLGTWRIYRDHCERFLIPSLGHLRLRQLRGQHIERVLNALTDNGYAPATVNAVWGTMHAAVSQAVRWGVRADNPCRQVERPQVPRYPARVLTEEELGRFLEAIRGHRLEAAFILCLALGLRAGEVLGLRWSDVDFGARTLTVAGSLQKGPDGKSRWSETKTDRSRRTLSFSEMPLVEQHLRAHQARQALERRIAGDAWQDAGWVFTSSRYPGRYCPYATFDSAFLRLRDRHGLPAELRPHDLRHSMATLLLEQGVDLTVLSRLLGHATTAVTDAVYAHVTERLQARSLAPMQRLIEQAQRG